MKTIMLLVASQKLIFGQLGAQVHTSLEHEYRHCCSVMRSKEVSNSTLTVKHVPLIATLAPICIASVLPGGKATRIDEKSCRFFTS